MSTKQTAASPKELEKQLKSSAEKMDLKVAGARAWLKTHAAPDGDKFVLCWESDSVGYWDYAAIYGPDQDVTIYNDYTTYHYVSSSNPGEYATGIDEADGWCAVYWTWDYSSRAWCAVYTSPKWPQPQAARKRQGA